MSAAGSENFNLGVGKKLLSSIRKADLLNTSVLVHLELELRCNPLPKAIGIFAVTT
jgi:hypothetical protein